jgi:multiple sugar transport system substrate-binding protein
VYEAGGTETEGYQQALLTQLAAGEAPDVFWIPGANIADFAQAGVILNLRELADASGHNDADFYPGPMAELTTNPDTGEVDAANYLWGLPRDVSSFILYLNNDLILEAGAEDPRELAAAGEWDWAAFQRVAEDLAALGGGVTPYGQTTWWGPAGYWMHGTGGGFYTADGLSCNLNSDESIAGLQFVTDFYAGGLGLAWGEDPEPVFKAGNLGMFPNGRWATPGLREAAAFDWDAVVLPDGPGGPTSWLFWGAYVVNADTENPEAAWQLVQALTTAEVQAQVAELGANIPSRVSQEALEAFLTYMPPENNQAFLDALANNPVTEAPDWIGDWPSYRDGLTTEVGAVISPEMLLRDESGEPVIAGENWGAPYFALDVTHPATEAHLRRLFAEFRDWGFDFFKLDFVYAAAFPGQNHAGIQRELAYRRGIETIRKTVGDDTYLLACGAPIIASLGVCDGIRVGPDVGPWWVAPDSDDPSIGTGARNAVATSVNRLWLQPAIDIDPDVAYFRSEGVTLDDVARQRLQQLAHIADVRGVSDPPAWLTDEERAALSAFLDTAPEIVKTSRYGWRLNGAEVDFSPALAGSAPVWGAVS